MAVVALEMLEKVIIEADKKITEFETLVKKYEAALQTNDLDYSEKEIFAKHYIDMFLSAQTFSAFWVGYILVTQIDDARWVEGASIKLDEDCIDDFSEVLIHFLSKVKIIKGLKICLNEEAEELLVTEDINGPVKKTNKHLLAKINDRQVIIQKSCGVGLEINPIASKTLNDIPGSYNKISDCNWLVNIKKEINTLKDAVIKTIDKPDLNNKLDNSDKALFDAVAKVAMEVKYYAESKLGEFCSETILKGITPAQWRKGVIIDFSMVDEIFHKAFIFNFCSVFKNLYASGISGDSFDMTCIDMPGILVQLKNKTYKQNEPEVLCLLLRVHLDMSTDLCSFLRREIIKSAETIAVSLIPTPHVNMTKSKSGAACSPVSSNTIEIVGPKNIPAYTSKKIEETEDEKTSQKLKTLSEVCEYVEHLTNQNFCAIERYTKRRISKSVMENILIEKEKFSALYKLALKSFEYSNEILAMQVGVDLMTKIDQAKLTQGMYIEFERGSNDTFYDFLYEFLRSELEKQGAHISKIMNLNTGQILMTLSRNKLDDKEVMTINQKRLIINCSGVKDKTKELVLDCFCVINADATITYETNSKKKLMSASQLFSGRMPQIPYSPPAKLMTATPPYSRMSPVISSVSSIHSMNMRERLKRVAMKVEQTNNLLEKLESKDFPEQTISHLIDNLARELHNYAQLQIAQFAVYEVINKIIEDKSKHQFSIKVARVGGDEAFYKIFSNILEIKLGKAFEICCEHPQRSMVINCLLPDVNDTNKTKLPKKFLILEILTDGTVHLVKKNPIAVARNPTEANKYSADTTNIKSPEYGSIGKPLRFNSASTATAAAGTSNTLEQQVPANSVSLALGGSGSSGSGSGSSLNPRS